MKFLILAAIACAACRYFFGKWPWEYLRGPGTRAQAVSRAQALLGVGAGATRVEIMEAHRRLIGIVHPDRGGTSDQVHEANAARDLLIAQLPPPSTPSPPPSSGTGP